MSFDHMCPTIGAQTQLFYINGSQVAPHANQSLADSGYSTYNGSSAILESYHSPWSVQIYYPQADSNSLGLAGSLDESASSFYQTHCHETNGVGSYLHPLDSSSQILSVKRNESLRSHQPEDITACSRKRHQSTDSVGFGEHSSRKHRQSKDSIGDGECSTRKFSPTGHRNSTGDHVSRRHSTSRHSTNKLSRRRHGSRDNTSHGDRFSRRNHRSMDSASNGDRLSRSKHGSRDNSNYVDQLSRRDHGNHVSRRHHGSRDNTDNVDQLSRRDHGSRNSTSNEDHVSKRHHGSRDNTSYVDQLSRRDHGSRDRTSNGDYVSRRRHGSRDNASYEDQFSRRHHELRERPCNEEYLSREHHSSRYRISYRRHSSRHHGQSREKIRDGDHSPRRSQGSNDIDDNHSKSVHELNDADVYHPLIKSRVNHSVNDADCFPASLDVKNYLRESEGGFDNLLLLDLNLIRGYHDSDNFRDVPSSACSKIKSDDYHLSLCSKRSSCHLKDTHRHYSLPRSEHCYESEDTNHYNIHAPPTRTSRRQSKATDKYDQSPFSKILCQANDTDIDSASSTLRNYQHSRGCDRYDTLPRSRNYQKSKDIASYMPSPVSKSYCHSRDTKEYHQSEDMCSYNPQTALKNYVRQKDPDKYDTSSRLRSSDIFEDDTNYEPTPISRDYYPARDTDSDSYYPSPRDYLQAKDTDKHYQPSTTSRNLLSRGTENHQLVSTKEGHCTEDIDDYRSSEDLRYYLLSKSDNKPKGPWYDRQSKGSGNHNSSAGSRRSHESKCGNCPDGSRHYKLSSKIEDPENFEEDLFEDMNDRILPADFDLGLDPAKPVLSFEKYTSLYQNERKIRLKKLRLLACKTFISKEKLAIAKICSSRGKDCNLKIEQRHDRPMAKSTGVGAVVHVLFDGVLAGTGAAGSKIQAKRNAFEAALRKIYMPYLRVYEGADKHRELQASIKPFSKASGQSQNAVMPMSKELLAATVWRRPSKKALDKMRRAANRRMKRLTAKPVSSPNKEKVVGGGIH